MGEQKRAKNHGLRRTIKNDRKLPKIVLRAGRLPTSVDRAESVLLGRCKELQIFQRAGELVRIISLPERHIDNQLSRPEGSVQLEPLSNTALTEIFNRIAIWRRQNSDGTVRIDCPPRIAGYYLARVGSWRVPILTGIISAPILRVDGSVLGKQGYDTATGLYLASPSDSPTIPGRPTRTDAKVALRTLLIPFTQFPFIADQDRAVHVACILTAIQRPLLHACPIFGYTAPAQRSGKSLLAESVAIIATGKPAPATAISGEREETRKMITSALREAHSIINLDNVEYPLASADLAKAITQPEYQDRALGTNRMLRLPTTVLWTATGNNLSFRGDLTSRALVCRIDAKVESPEARTFQIPQLRTFLETNRDDLVSAALTILRAYHVAGSPRQPINPWGGFEDWSASIREALIWVGMTDPCETRSAVIADDPEREDSLTVLRALHEKFGGNKFTARRILRRLESSKLLRTAIEVVGAGHNKEVDPRRLGWWLRRNHNRIIGGLRLESVGKTSGSARWRVVEVEGGHSGQGGQIHGSGETIMRFPRLGNSPKQDGTIIRFPRLRKPKNKVRK